MKTKLILIALGAVIVLGIGASVLKVNKGADNIGAGGGPVACTQEAKLCPDGSAVGRMGPKCEFAPCPSEALCEGGPCSSEALCEGGPCPSPVVDDGRIAGGYVAGHVNIGPFCPVEKVGEPCNVPPEAYTSRQAVIYYRDGVTIRDRINLDKKGNYKYALGPGNYFIQIQPAGIGPGEMKPFTVISFQTTTVNFDIDTGIR